MALTHCPGKGGGGNKKYSNPRTATWKRTRIVRTVIKRQAKNHLKSLKSRQTRLRSRLTRPGCRKTRNLPRRRNRAKPRAVARKKVTVGPNRRKSDFGSTPLSLKAGSNIKHCVIPEGWPVQHPLPYSLTTSLASNQTRVVKKLIRIEISTA